MLVSGARNFATGLKNRRQKPTPVFWRRFLEHVSKERSVIRNEDDVGGRARVTGDEKDAIFVFLCSPASSTEAILG